MACHSFIRALRPAQGNGEATRPPRCISGAGSLVRTFRLSFFVERAPYRECLKGCDKQTYRRPNGPRGNEHDSARPGRSIAIWTHTNPRHDPHHNSGSKDACRRAKYQPTATSDKFRNALELMHGLCVPRMPAQMPAPARPCHLLLRSVIPPAILRTFPHKAQKSPAIPAR